MADKTRTYEGLFLFGTAAGTNLQGTLDRVAKLVTDAGGEVILNKKFDERRLAYEIKKQKRGLYVLCYFSAPNTTVSAIDREVRLSDDVLRHLIISADHLSREEMEAMEPQKYEPIELDPDRPRRRPAPTEATEGQENEGGSDDPSGGDAERADAETAAPAGE